MSVDSEDSFNFSVVLTCDEDEGQRSSDASGGSSTPRSLQTPAGFHLATRAQTDSTSLAQQIGRNIAFRRLYLPSYLCDTVCDVILSFFGRACEICCRTTELLHYAQRWWCCDCYEVLRESWEVCNGSLFPLSGVALIHARLMSSRLSDIPFQRS